MKKIGLLMCLLFFLTACPAPRVPSPTPTEGSSTEKASVIAAESFQKGLANLNANNLVAAIQFFNLTIQQDPTYIKAYQKLAEVYITQEKYEVAEQNYLRVLEFMKPLESDPTSVPTLLNLGYVQTKQKKYEEALGNYRKALEISPQNPVARDRLASLQPIVFDTHFQKGLELKKRGERDAALEEFRTAQALFPQKLELLVEVGTILLERKEYDTADKYFQQILASNPDSISALLGAGEVELARGGLKKARSYFEKVLNLQPDNAQARAFINKFQEEAPSPVVNQPGQPIDRIPKEYRRIATRETITRSDLAVLIVVELDLEEKVQASSELASSYQVQPLSDIADHWAKSYILKATGYRLMEPLPDHTFQPDEEITRGELAVTIDQIFTAFSKPLTAVPTPDYSPSFSDVPLENIYYRAVMRTSRAGIIIQISDSEFGLGKSISGKEVIEILAKVKEMLQ
jgi:Tfp pilus assembly protein PilF